MTAKFFIHGTITFYYILGKENQPPDKSQQLEQCTDIPLASTVAGNLFIIESFLIFPHQSLL